MDDHIALTVACISGVALATGLAAETALHDYSQTKLERMLDDEDRVGRVSARLKSFGKLARSIRLFNILAIVMLVGALFSARSEGRSLFDDIGAFLWAWVLIGLGLHGLVGGIASRAAERTLLALLGFITVVSRLMQPFLVPVEAMARFVGRLFGASGEDASEEDEAVEEILDAVAEGEAEGVLEGDAADYIENIMEFRERVTREVMTPRTSIVCGAKDMTFDETLALLMEHGHSRIPLFEENRDNIVGILHFKDVLRHHEDIRAGSKTLADVMRPPLFVPESKLVSELLKQMRADSVHFAVVLDEFGGTAGLVTIEDIVEEIVGELRDEFEEADDVNDIDRVGEHQVEVDAKIPIDYLSEQLCIEIPDDGDFDTIGGLLASRLGKVPEKGENIAINGIFFEVKDADARKAKRVLVTTAGHPSSAE